MRRLMAKMVLKGFVIACRFAICPTSRSPSSVKPTTDGVVRLPSRFGMTCGVVTSTTATQELVVPRSIPMIFAMSYFFQGTKCPFIRLLPRRAGEKVPQADEGALFRPEEIGRAH